MRIQMMNSNHIFQIAGSRSVWHTVPYAICCNIAHLLKMLMPSVQTRKKTVHMYVLPEAVSAPSLRNVGNIEKLLDMYGNNILRLAYSYLHDMSDAEDILQDTLIKYMQSAPAFLTESHKKAWLLRVATNLSKNKISYNRIRETDELEETLIAEEREDLSFVWEAVSNLPTRYREVIHLYYQEGYPTKEISKILNRNESSVRSDLKRGREALKKVLKEAYDFE